MTPLQIQMVPRAGQRLPDPATREASRRAEAALLGRLTRLDEDADRQAVQRLHRHLYQVARRHVRDAATAEDVVQDTWLAVIAGVERFQGRSWLRTWASRIATNLAITRASRDARCRPLASPPTDRDPGAHRIWTRPAATPEQALLARERQTAIARAIAALPPRQRAVLTLRDLLGATPQEACRQVGVTQGNQRVLLHRARTKVRAAVVRGEELRASPLENPARGPTPRPSTPARPWSGSRPSP